MRDPLLERVAASLGASGLLGPGGPLLVAVSGGPDSLCLLHLLLRLRERGGPPLHVAHLDHGARGAQSRAEAEAVAALAAAWGLPATVARRDVPALAAARREGLQAAARRARYAFLAEVALAVGARAVAVAHQADDQAETVLLHALRGAGPAGLRGMRPLVPWAEWGGGAAAGPPLARPLLLVPRDAIEAYCAAQGLAPARDPSNSAPRFARARVRRLLPVLAAENPRLIAALGRTARVCADDHDFIQGQLDAAWPALAVEAPGVVTLRRAAWVGLHPSLQRYALRRAAARLGQAELSLELVEAARELAGKSGRSMGLGPRLRLIVEQETFALVASGAQPGGPASPHRDVWAPTTGAHNERPNQPTSGPPGAFPQLDGEELPLATPGVTPLGAGWACLTRLEAPEQPGPWWVALDAAALDGPLALRRRRAGDRFRPAGGRGGRRLQDFFVDRKVPRGLRDAWPILATPGAVVWVAGLRADGRFLAGPATRSTIWVGIVEE